MYPYYTKKEDVINLIKMQRRYLSIIFFAVAVVLAVMQIFILPKVLSIYQQLNLTIPFATKHFFEISVLTIIVALAIAVRLFFSEPDQTKIEQKLLKFSSQEMIKTSEVIDRKIDTFVMLLLGVAVGYAVLSVILPIYNLSASF